MKRFTRFCTYLAVPLIVVVFVTYLSSCGGDGGGNEPSIKEVNTTLLTSGTWKIGTLKVDGVDKSTLATGMTLQFSATGYTSTNGDPVWPATGTWTFTDDSATTIRRNDDLQVSITSISASSLVLTLTWSKTTLGKGRTASVAGQNVFSFTK